jgi:hypothetical protein
MVLMRAVGGLRDDVDAGLVAQQRDHALAGERFVIRD